jgi:hypothetical protein
MKVAHYTYSEENKGIYEIIRLWDVEAFPEPAMLPKLGCVVECEQTGEFVAFVCADMSNSIPRAMMDNLQTNPDVSPTKRLRAVRLAEGFICERLKHHGYSVIMGVSPHAGVASISQSMGYTESPKVLAAFTKTI